MQGASDILLDAQHISLYEMRSKIPWKAQHILVYKLGYDITTKYFSPIV